MSETVIETTAEPALPGMETQDMLRQDVRAIMKTEGKSAAQVAREAGMASPTFSAWINNAYAGDNEAQAEKVRAWLNGRKAAQRTRAAMPKAPGYQPTKSGELIMGVLEHAQHAPDFVLVSGGPGVGKTESCCEYKKKSSNVFLITGQPCWSTPGMLLGELVDALSLSTPGSKQKTTRAIINRLIGSNGLLLVDEAQHLSSLAIDQLRTFHDLAGIGVALVGNETVSSRVEGDWRRPSFSQLYSRIGMRISRPKPYKADIEMMLDAWHVDGARERQLLQAIAQKPGALRGFTKTLRLACIQASAGGREAVNETDIARAWSQISQTELLAEAA